MSREIDNSITINTVTKDECVACVLATVDEGVTVCSDGGIDFNDVIAVIDNKIASGGRKIDDGVAIDSVVIQESVTHGSATSKLGIAVSSDSGVEFDNCIAISAIFI